MHADRNHVNILPARGGRQNLLGVALNRRLRVTKRIVSWNFVFFFKAILTAPNLPKIIFIKR